MEVCYIMDDLDKIGQETTARCAVGNTRSALVFIAKPPTLTVAAIKWGAVH